MSEVWSWLGFDEQQRMDGVVQRLDLTTKAGEVANFSLDTDEFWSGQQELVLEISGDIGDGALVHVDIIVAGTRGQKIHIVSRLDLAKQAHLEVTELLACDGEVSLARQIDLAGADSKVAIKTVYVVRSGKLSWQTLVNHSGQRTESHLETVGWLAEGAYKSWQASLDMHVGCSESKGSENETVWVTGKNVVNKSLPIIKADEQDMRADHSVAIGQIPEEIVVYMRSRGWRYDEARQYYGKENLRHNLDSVSKKSIQNKLYNIIDQIVK